MREREINKENYFETVEDIGIKFLPVALKQTHKVISEKTTNGSDWSKYNSDSNLKKISDLAFKKLQEFLRTKHGLNGIESPAVLQAKEDAKVYEFMDTEQLKRILRMEYSAEQEDGPRPEIEIRKKALQKILTKREGKASATNPFEPETKTTNRSKQSFTEELKFFNQILKLNGKVKSKEEIGLFIDALQFAIKNKKLRKKSSYQSEIMEIQNRLVDIHNTMGDEIVFNLRPETLERVKQSIASIKKKNKSVEQIPEPKETIELMGLNGAVKDSAILESTEFVKMEFPSMGFKGKWLEFIGDPSPGFRASVSGMPKMGKSFLCVEFADYLGENHGKTLYVTKEEFMSPTFQLKLKEKNVNNANLDVTGTIPKDLSPYQSIFVDSVTSLKLTPDDLLKLEEKNPNKNFIYVHQVTKAGKARGSNEYIHNVDIVITVPEKGKAVQNGRFNQGGSMDIFVSESNAEKKEHIQVDEELSVKENVSTLSGMKNNDMKKQKTKSKLDLSKYDQGLDDFNPRFLFRTEKTELLVTLLKDKIDLNYLLRIEFANRGLDKDGKWVGFPKAAKIHQIE